MKHKGKLVTDSNTDFVSNFIMFSIPIDLTECKTTSRRAVAHYSLCFGKIYAILIYIHNNLLSDLHYIGMCISKIIC